MRIQEYLQGIFALAGSGQLTDFCRTSCLVRSPSASSDRCFNSKLKKITDKTGFYGNIKMRMSFYLHRYL